MGPPNRFKSSLKILIGLSCLVLAVFFFTTWEITRADAFKGFLLPPSSQEASRLIKEQKVSLNQFKQKQKVELTQFRANQDIQLKEWEMKEREARREFFAAHETGPERRDYVKAFLQRRDELKKKMASEKADQIKAQAAALEKFKAEQASELKGLQEKLNSAGSEGSAAQ